MLPFLKFTPFVLLFQLLNPRYLHSSKPDHRITTHGVNNDVRLMDLNDTSEEQFTYLNDEVDHRFYISEL